LGDLVKYKTDGKTVIEKKAVDSRVEIIDVKNKSLAKRLRKSWIFGMNNLKFLWQKNFSAKKYKK
jgi:hypothetical protein